MTSTSFKSSKEGMRKAFDRFYGKITSGSVALVFFSGYAIQSARQSYIIPVDGQISDRARRAARRRQPGYNSQGDEHTGRQGKDAILDASRRNPFERRFRPVSAGLAPVDAPTGSLVMYSSAPSTVVNDSGNEHRLFVNELVSHLRVAELTAQEVFDRTRVGVSRGSQGQQVPWLSSSLVSDFSFGSGPKVAAAAPATSAPAATPAAPATPGPRPVVIPKMEPLAPESKPAPQPISPGPQAALPATPPPPAAAPPAPVTISPEDTAAIQDLNRKIRSNPNDAIALYRRGQIYAKNDDFSAPSWISTPRSGSIRRTRKH